MIKLSENRLEAFSDGVIAIIITIMVLNIPLPNTFGFNEIMGLLASIFVFFVSFFVVGSQWNKHHHLFDDIKEVSSKIIWRNFLYLFFLSLMPIFTKWVMQNPDEVVPAIGYDIVFFLVNISFQFMRNCVIKENDNDEMKKKIEKWKAEIKFPWLHVVIIVVAMVAIIVLSFFYPRISLIFFIALPVISSLFNLISENDSNDRRRLVASGQNRGMAKHNRK